MRETNHYNRRRKILYESNRCFHTQQQHKPHKIISTTTFFKKSTEVSGPAVSIRTSADGKQPSFVDFIALCSARELHVEELEQQLGRRSHSACTNQCAMSFSTNPSQLSASRSEALLFVGGQHECWKASNVCQHMRYGRGSCQTMRRCTRWSCANWKINDAIKTSSDCRALHPEVSWWTTPRNASFAPIGRVRGKSSPWKSSPINVRPAVASSAT